MRQARIVGVGPLVPKVSLLSRSRNMNREIKMKRREFFKKAGTATAAGAVIAANILEIGEKARQTMEKR